MRPLFCLLLASILFSECKTPTQPSDSSIAGEWGGTYIHAIDTIHVSIPDTSVIDTQKTTFELVISEENGQASGQGTAVYSKYSVYHNPYTGQTFLPGTTLTTTSSISVSGTVSYPSFALQLDSFTTSYIGRFINENEMKGTVLVSDGDGSLTLTRK